MEMEYVHSESSPGSDEPFQFPEMSVTTGTPVVQFSVLEHLAAIAADVGPNDFSILKPHFDQSATLETAHARARRRALFLDPLGTD